MDAIGALMLFVVTAVGTAAVLLLRAGFARRLAGAILGLTGPALLLATVHPLLINPQHGPGGLMTVFIVWAGLVFGGIGMTCGLWFGALLFGRRPTLAGWALTFAIAALLSGVILPPVLYLTVEVRTALHASDLSESIGGVSADVFTQPHPPLMKVFRYSAGNAQVLVDYGPARGGPAYYLYLRRDGVRWQVLRFQPVDNTSDACTACFTVPPY